jgi:hypothetical protein|tara:strand:- start:800 stop:934 length:135 start_codon:yes stop_codon:yes gene_type:complete
MSLSVGAAGRAGMRKTAGMVMPALLRRTGLQDSVRNMPGLPARQ